MSRILKIVKFVFIAAFVFLNLNSVFSQLTWTRLPGPPTGNIRDVVVSSTGTIFLAHANFMNDGGLYRSTNNGANFSRIFPGPGSDLRSLVLDRVNNIYYAALGNGGVRKSINNGLTWTEIGFILNDVNEVFCDRNGNVFAGYGATIQRSTNGGSNWELVYTAPSFMSCYAQDSSGNIFGGSVSSGIYRSTNNGSNWVNVYPANKINNIHVSSLNTIFAATVDSGLFQSTNNGQSWGRMNIPFTDVGSVYTIGNTILAATSNGIFRSTNSGINWSFISDIFDGTSFTTDLQNNILLGTEYGVYRTSNEGSSWSYLGLHIAAVEDVRALNNGKVFALTYGLEPYENLVWVSDDVGNTWKRVLKTTEYLDKMDIDSTNRLFICSSNGIIYTSNNGSNWIHIGPLGTATNRVRINSTGEIFVCTNNGILKTTNMGLNWINCSPVAEPFRSLTITPANTIFAANYATGNNCFIYRSTNSGTNWTNLGNPADPTYWVNSIVSDFNGNIYTQILYSIYKSTNNGNSWGNTAFFGTTYNLYSTPFNHIYFSINSPWRTTDGGASYEELIGAGGTCLAYHPSNVMLAGSNNSGLYRSSILTSIHSNNNQVPENYVLLSNYPNPFNPNTTISFDVSSYYINLDDNIKISIHDILGKEVAVLLNEKLNAGEYEINWNAENFSSGIYFCKMSSNSFNKIHKMILLK